jgi:hypothetical protein
MALIRVRGNSGGIVNYLKTGQKSGRTLGRDELDERVSLRGDIEQLDAVIKSIHASRIKYTHITISFKEDEVDPTTLSNVLDFYEEHIFSAFKKNEYCLYAEAHLPLTKGTINEKGEVKARKPHIHIIVPNKNLVTGSAVNPWGGVYLHHEKYFEAIQEAMNLKFGLISPSLNRRTDFTMESSIYEGTKGDVFSGNNIHLKQIILDHVLENNISSTDELRELLRTIGEQKTRNQGRLNEYEAIKPHGASKFTNLRHFVFSQKFLQLAPQEKKNALKPKEENGYLSVRTPEEIPDNVNALLIEWRHLRSKQIKYLDKNAPAHYKSLSNDEKIAFLEIKEKEYYRKLSAFNDLNTFPSPASQQPHENIPKRPSAIYSDPSPKAGRRRDSAISQLIKDRADEPACYAPELNALVPIWNANIDINFLLAELVYSHRLIREKYQSSGQEKPGEAPIARDRIRCGKRNLSVSDFLRREMHMPWPLAFSYMRQTMAKQSKFVPNLDPQCGVPNAALWIRFRKNRSETQKRLTEEINRCLEQLSSSAFDTKTSLDLHRSYDRFTMFQIKMPDHIRKLFLALIDAEYLEQKSHVAGDHKQTRRQLNNQRLKLSCWNLYLSFLHQHAVVTPKYLTELRKHAAAHEIPRDSLYLAGRREAEVNDIGLVRALELTRTIKGNGDIIYERNGGEFLRDEGGLLVINTVSGSPAIRAAFMLANEKWGAAYSIGGPEELQKAANALALMLRVESSSGRSKPTISQMSDQDVPRRRLPRHDLQ